MLAINTIALQALTYGLAGFGCAMLVYLIARSLARTWQDGVSTLTKTLEQNFHDEDEW